MPETPVVRVPFQVRSVLTFVAEMQVRVELAEVAERVELAELRVMAEQAELQETPATPG